MSLLHTFTGDHLAALGDLLAGGPRQLKLKATGQAALSLVPIASVEFTGAVDPASGLTITVEWTLSEEILVHDAVLTLQPEGQLSLVNYHRHSGATAELDNQLKRDLTHVVEAVISLWSNDANPKRELYRRVGSRRKEHEKDDDPTIYLEGTVLASEWELAAFGPDRQENRSFDRLIHLKEDWVVRANNYLAQTR